MIVRFTMERKQIWLLGIACSGAVGMMLVNYSVTGSVLPIPHISPTAISESASTPHPDVAAVQKPSMPQEQQPLPSPHEEPAVKHASLELPPASSTQTSQTNQTGPVPPKAAGSKKIALTFDDGPDHKYTPQVLDILKENGVKATFFVVGDQVKKYPDVLRRIHAEGHAIGNHSWDHADLSKLSVPRIDQEIRQTDDYVKQLIGVSPSMVRAPYGAVSPALKKEVELTGRQLVSWNVDPRDWAGTSVTDIVYNVQTHAKAGGIILMHSFGGKDGKLDNTIEALPQIIAFLQQNDFELVTVPELSAER
ncbi:polysaccharide deacetylase family protein [Paenibacillus oryzisoli]|uniref:polysaccharide deacetylase family protein n=1 Tax=Paenibacillus oryzisoli TaxID=1850517 RepID=UPI003D2B7E28